MSLTNMQEAFCKAMLTEKNQSDAYRKAYPLSRKWKDATVNVKASELMSNGKVLVRVEELRAEADKELIKTFTKSKSDVLHKLESLIEKADKWLLETETNKETPLSFKDFVKYTKEVRDTLKEQAKILGYYEEVHKHIGDPANPIQHELIVNFIGVDK